MTFAPESASDVVTLLARQHEQINLLFGEVLDLAGDRRMVALATLCRLLAVHEATEQEIVHPRARYELADGQLIVTARLAEEEALTQALAELDHLDVSTAPFEDAIHTLRSRFRQHARSEEQEEFAGLRIQLGSRQLERMRRAVQLATPEAAGCLNGRFQSMLDDARRVIIGPVID